MIDPLQRINNTPWTAPKTPVVRAEKPLPLDPQESFTFQGFPAPAANEPVFQAAANEPVFHKAAVPVPAVLSMVEELPVQDKVGVMADMMGREVNYLSAYPYKEGGEQIRGELTRRYQDSVAGAQHFHQEALEFAKSRAVDPQKLPDGLQGKAFDLESAALIKKELAGQVKAYFASSQGSTNPLKEKLSQQECDRFVDLIGQCQAEGSLGKVSAGDVYRLASSNLNLLALQDRAAAEITFGEHGVRHLVGHNIMVCEKLCDQMQAQGVQVSAKDRLILHQAMLVHDMGYAVDNVRGDFAKNGIKTQDSGHPLLAGRYVRERLQNDTDPINAIFSPEEMNLMQRCVLYHDMDAEGKSGVKLHMSAQPSALERQQNLESITRLADNSHALDDKVSDVLYRHPAALKTMRLIKTAGEVGDEAKVKSLQDGLKRELDARSDLSADDKAGLKQAVNQMSAGEYEFSARRLVGGKPDYQVDAQGNITITLRESPIHKQIAQVSGQEPLKLLAGYMQDLSGVRPQVDRNTRRVEAGNLRFNLEPAQDLDDYQKAVASVMLADDSFRGWAVRDADMGKTQKGLSNVLEAAASLTDQQLRRHAAVYLDSVEAPREQILSALQAQLSDVKEQRRQALYATA
ncbi:MAG: hypothetical protein KF760_19865 [Candidatus Eremiobacteraeota bacterium]|nr:hypothetical protein [Candidatus Eremiobacteraeota bacterium]MCW5868035.1 hypothetical protein [Candidatus Eremiobacteraeota bacterium]